MQIAIVASKRLAIFGLPSSRYDADTPQSAVRVPHARSLARLRQQDKRRRVGGLRRKGEVEEDERVRIPVRHDRDGVERDPGDDDERLPDNVSRRSEEARRAFCPPTEGICTEGAVVGQDHESTASRGQWHELLRSQVAQRLTGPPATAPGPPR